MNRLILVCAVFIAAAAALGAQDASHASPYQGTSNPPPDDNVLTTSTLHAKLLAGQYASIQPDESAHAAPKPASVEPWASDPAPSSDDGIVHPKDSASANQVLISQPEASDPDGDIVHPRALLPGDLPEGTAIRVTLLQRLSTASSEKGEAFSSRVASDVVLGDKVLIPAGAEIDGRVVQVSSGHAGGHGSMHLLPEAVVLPDGTRFHLSAEVTGTPGSRTRLGNEGTILPGSRLKRDSIEYGGAVGGGAVTGAFLGGPVGAMTGGLIGAGVVTAHLLISHPQATLETGTTLLFTLTEPLNMVPAGASEN
jgi:hypothetical protein